MRITLLTLFHLIIINAFAQDRLNEEKFITINGIEQWVTIKGNKTKPAVLFLHGGPGSPLSPYADSIFKEWEKDFILVQWDQRGTGKTFGRNRPEEVSVEYLKSHPLSIGQMMADGIELTKYLLKHLGKQKIILFGTSWGSALGVKMVIKNPELFYAYIGHSQMVNPLGAMLYAYGKVYKMAKNGNDQKSLDVLKSIGEPPYDTAKHLGQFMRVVKLYQQKNSIKAPAHWVQSSAYSTEKDELDRADGDDYSFVNYAGDVRFGIEGMYKSINFLFNALEFKIPVYFIQGEDDIQTPAILNKEYFNKIKAPKKKFISLPKTDHGFNQSVIDAQYRIMKDIKSTD